MPGKRGVRRGQQDWLTACHVPARSLSQLLIRQQVRSSAQRSPPRSVAGNQRPTNRPCEEDLFLAPRLFLNEHDRSASPPILR